ncbi:low-affinity Zn(2+) transporter zrt2 [Trebouxia sp. C0009 RCD-2024]
MAATEPALGEIPAENPCYAPGDPGLLGLRLGGLFGILAVSTIGVAIPFFTYKAKLNSVFCLVRAFAAGVVLTTGYVHVLADALPILQHPCLGLSTEYPWAMAIATAATLGTFTLEWVLHKTF